MELRSGTIVNTTTVPTWVPNLDGKDYIPHTVTEEFPWDWSVRLREYMEEDNWCPETAYYFVDFLDRTSNDWVDICFAPTSRNDTKSFGETLMNIVYQLKGLLLLTLDIFFQFLLALLQLVLILHLYKILLLVF